MPNYQLAIEAEDDLRAIARYTISKWGIKQARQYERLLSECFDAIGQKEAVSRAFLNRRPDLRYVYCEHHYIFYTERDDNPVLILAIFHENMNLMTRLEKRLRKGNPVI